MYELRNLSFEKADMTKVNNNTVNNYIFL